MKSADVLKRIGDCGIVPVVVLDRAEDAIPTAKAFLAGGVDIMEITLRTKAGMASIRQVAENCPEICVGAGTVLTLEQCKQAVEAGARFIVAPGFDRELVQWCINNNILVTPGCVTPTEITEALSLGVNVLKFFPANVYGGLSAMKSLAAPFGGVKFVPTGGISDKNLAEYVSAPFIHAVGGSWLCDKQDIANGNFAAITAFSADAIKTALGFELAHVGINCNTAEESMQVCNMFDSAFNTGIKTGASSNFASSGIEVMNSKYLGDNGHIAMKTANISRAISVLAKRGFEVDMDTAKYKGEDMIAVYLKQSFGGFAVHLLQK
ncbi:MAG: bifunctional 4-hydroxy-2-oxoglutarate aldolase/2-dehydro-3-deoxy-phosphogluconate aldolase [Defluviitaleaceae bacterium]|nr:bifunctional 4-hydroxy-2-oxoglutarate aldolase/2-dehydro-3-deoxy-phosphogluconate aldolase [Defluviitaleaceae bacterium]